MKVWVVEIYDNNENNTYIDSICVSKQSAEKRARELKDYNITSYSISEWIAR